MRFSMNVVTLSLLLLSLNLCAHAHLHTAERAETEAGDGAGETLKGRASNGAMISETVYDRIAASAKGQVQKKQIDSKGSTIIVDNTNGLATIVNGKDDIDELKQKHDHERTTKKDNEEKFKQETEDQKKRDIQLRQAKRERKEEQHKKDAQLSADQVVSDAKDRQKRAEQKAKVRKSKEQTNKYFVDFTGLCTVASTCPPGWDNKGLAGIIVHKRHEDSNSFKKGEEFDSDWRWMHPYVCCAANQMSQINDLFVFSRKCPKGSKNQGMAGIIMVKKNYDKNPFHNGGNYNDYWRWSHPYACQTPNSKIIKTTGTCLFAASCPQNWSDAGYGGILIHRNYYAKQPFHKGGEYNDSWQWAHPRVCCL